MSDSDTRKKQCPISDGLSGIIINGILNQDAGLTVNAGSALLSGKNFIWRYKSYLSQVA